METVEISAHIINNEGYPRLKVNNKGEIVLATSKSIFSGLTRGVLVGYTEEAKDRMIPLGSVLCDWEVAGELFDYHGSVNITLKNGE